jgi:hypothetical protein
MIFLACDGLGTRETGLGNIAALTRPTLTPKSDDRGFDVYEMSRGGGKMGHLTCHHYFSASHSC